VVARSSVSRADRDRYASYPIAANPGNSVTTSGPKLRMGYVQSWNLSVQRELSKSTVLDVRYVGNTRSVSGGR
jgi:hypothetical protein